MRIETKDKFDACVIGGGHAGCEAALALSRTGHRTLLLCTSLDSIAMMPCNPNIGGTSKGHLVREIDALGGEMGRNIDKSFIQSRMLNTSKGPAVRSLRAQADKTVYQREMLKALYASPNLIIRQQEAVDFNVKDGRLVSVVTESGAEIEVKAAVIAAGTYLSSRCLYGEAVSACGPNGLRSSVRLSESLKRLGIAFYRFKTGTPARIARRSIDFSRLAAQGGDDPITPFSFENEERDLSRDQALCWLGYTNEETHDIIRAGIDRSPMYSGVIEGTGTRYCPSIEDKVMRFPDKNRHQVFVEPEGDDSDEMYISGMSTSLPDDIQTAMYRSVVGLENAEITRFGYAIEYDCLDSTQLKLSLEFKDIQGLFAAGQLNGSSGYEEAAAQGIMAGLNAHLLIEGRDALILDRSEAYIGVLIDDLVTKGTAEPYRMMTSRAEYRLLLRQDNADLRLSEKGYNAGLLSQERYFSFVNKKNAVQAELARVMRVNVAPTAELNALLAKHCSAEVSTGIKLVELIRRPELSYQLLAAADPERPAISAAAAEQVNVNIKFEGYIKRQNIQVSQFKKLESRKLPADFDYTQVRGLRAEAAQKLKRLKPENIGQASRITGVSPADLSVLLVFMKHV